MCDTRQCQSKKDGDAHNLNTALCKFKPLVEIMFSLTFKKTGEDEKYIYSSNGLDTNAESFTIT